MPELLSHFSSGHQNLGHFSIAYKLCFYFTLNLSHFWQYLKKKKKKTQKTHILKHLGGMLYKFTHKKKTPKCLGILIPRNKHPRVRPHLLFSLLHISMTECNLGNQELKDEKCKHVTMVVYCSF